MKIEGRGQGSVLGTLLLTYFTMDAPQTKKQVHKSAKDKKDSKHLGSGKGVRAKEANLQRAAERVQGGK